MAEVTDQYRFPNSQAEAAPVLRSLVVMSAPASLLLVMLTRHHQPRTGRRTFVLVSAGLLTKVLDTELGHRDVGTEPLRGLSFTIIMIMLMMSEDQMSLVKVT